MSYERTARIEHAAEGVISGVLTTDGEASDGHILNIDGGQLPSGAPLLFGHDDWSGTGNLGSWRKFEKVDLPKGRRGIRGEAGIELGGSGAQQEWREDVNHMIEQGHVGAFSIRWEETVKPQRRINLPSDHPAYLDGEKAEGRNFWGLYFEKWRMLEGSVVTLGADPAALIGRMQRSTGAIRTFWRGAINDQLAHRIDAGAYGENLVSIETADGPIFVERAAHEAMLEVANERLQLALDIHEDALVPNPVRVIHSDGDGESSNGLDDPAPRNERESAATLTVNDRTIAAFERAVSESDDLFDQNLEEMERRITGRIQ